MIPSQNGLPTPLGTLDEVLDIGDTSEKPMKVFIGHNLGNRTFLMQMPMHEFFGMSEVANDPGRDGDQLAQRKLDPAHAHKLAVYMLKGLVSASIERRQISGKEVPEPLKAMMERMGRQPYMALQPIVVNIRDCNPRGADILCQRDNIYGRLRRMSDGGSLEEVFDVTAACLDEGYDLSRDWTEVVLFGNRADQNTLRDPYEQNPAMNGQWLADYLYHRFYRLPAGLVVRFKPGAHKLDGTRTFRTIPDRAYSLGKSESVTLVDGTKIHYFYDPPLANSSHNKSVSGAITTDVSTCAIVYKNEFYDLLRGRQWTLDAPIYGVTFGAKHISIHIELIDDSSVRPEAYRQFLRYREGDQRQVLGQDFAHLVRENRPAWLIDLINSLAPTDSGNTNEIRDELQRLLNSLRVKTTSPRLNVSGDVTVEFGAAGGGGSDLNQGDGRSDGKSPRVRLDDLLAVPTGAKRARISLNAERAPEIIPLHDESAIEEKGLKGKAAKFYPEAGQLFVNMHYHSVAEMRTQLELEYAHATEPEAMRRMAKELSERTMIIRVGRAVVYALAKQLNQEWTTEDMARAQSPESLSIAADDFIDGLQNVRRRMGIALRAVRHVAEEPVT